MELKEDLELFEKKILQGVFDEELAHSLASQKGKPWFDNRRELASALKDIEKQLLHVFGPLPEIVTTVGVYPNGPSVVNAVQKEHLLYHVYYNLTFRMGRGLLIHGRIFYSGNVSDQKLQQELCAHGSKVFDKNSAPYH